MAEAINPRRWKRPMVFIGVVLCSGLIFSFTVMCNHEGSTHFMRGTYRGLTRTENIHTHLASSIKSHPDWNSPISLEQYRRFQSNYLPGQNDEADAKLGRYIRERLLIGPPTVPDSSKLRHGDASQEGQSSYIDRLLTGRRDGFFVECGAANGLELSNSLFFEMERNWTGLLIEANPTYFRSLVDKNRNAYAINTCLSLNSHVSEVEFKPADELGGITDKLTPNASAYIQNKYAGVSSIKMTCFPLFALLDALGVAHVDYFSLDVEGPEVEVLETIPFDKITFDVISVEYRVFHGPAISSVRKLQTIRDFFKRVGGYKEAGILPWIEKQNVTTNERYGLDVLFQRIV